MADEINGSGVDTVVPTADSGVTGTPTGEPTVDSAVTAPLTFDGMTPEKLHQSYKSLQGEYTKVNQGYKELAGKFDSYGGTEQVSKYLEFLSNNPRFAQWIESEKQYSALGVDPSSVDDETRKALGIVRQVSDQIAEEKINRAIAERVAPLEDSYKQRLLQENVKQLDATYPDWHEMKDVMADIAEKLPHHIQDNPSYKDLETLYIKALIETGKLEDMQAKAYEKKLQAVKSKAVEKPANSAPVGTPTKVRNIKEAFERAKKQIS